MATCDKVSLLTSEICRRLCQVATTFALLVNPLGGGAHGREPASEARLAVPPDAAVAEARDLVRQAYEEKFKAAESGSPSDLISVLSAAADKSNVPERKYAMLVEAEQAAASAGDMGQVIDLVLKRSAVFRVDPLTESLVAVTRVLDANRKENPSRLGGVMEQGLRLAAAAMAADRLEEALLAADMASDAAKAVTLAAKPSKKAIKDQSLVEFATNTTKHSELLTRTIRRRIKARDEMSEAKKKLESSPDDPAANAAVGAYECFVLGEWDRGLPRLVKSDAEDLKDVAAEEIRISSADAPPAKDLFDLAGRWWTVADAEGTDDDTSTAIKSHAAALYAASLAGLSDPLDMEIAKKRSRGAKTPRRGRVESGSDRPPGMYPARSDAEQRMALVKAGGGNEQSEAAVEAAIKWLAVHQMPDGGWSFDMNDCCGGKCRHGGTLKADRGAATALALLPFLGRGYTHTSGPYKEKVFKGINFLAALVVAGNGKMKGSGMYSQGVAGICLSESYAMTQDNRLQMPTQLAMNYIMDGQDPVGGGWRYGPKQPGDTSASGWHLVALRIGADAKLQINPSVITKMSGFLDSVQKDGGALYGYTGPGDGPATSAVGLLCRMHLGWKSDHPAIRQGAARLAELGPSKDVYFDFYANQVMYRVGGDAWLAWNTKLRDLLLQGQDKAGHEAGSWYDAIDGGHGAHVAGRLYCTSLATLILENYYRNAPVE